MIVQRLGMRLRLEPLLLSANNWWFFASNLEKEGCKCYYMFAKAALGKQLLRH